MPTDDNTPDPIDDLARRAGAELRRPAPEDGLAGVHRSHRRRRTATAAGAAAALMVIAGGTIALANRGGDDDVVVTEDRSIPFDPSVSLGDLSGTWWLTELNGEMVESDPDAEEAPWVVITEERLTGYFGCNWVDANAPDLGVVDGRLVASFRQSARGCGDEEQQATELALKELLRASPQVGIDGDTLRWSGAGHVATFARSADGRLPSPFSSSTTSTTIAADVIAGTWWLIAIDGEPIEVGVDAVAQPWIRVGDGDMSGFLGCNGFSVADASYAGERLIVDVDTFVREQKGCGGVAGDLGPMRTENAVGDLIEAGPTVSVAGENMFWSDGEQSAAFERAPVGWSPATTEPVTATTLPGTATTVLAPTTAVPTTTVPVTTTTAAPTPVSPDGFAVSDEALPDPKMFGADGFLRELVDRSIVVRSSPEAVIPLDLPEPDLWLIGVGPDGIAYLQAEEAPSADDSVGRTRILAIPTTGSNIGGVFVLFGPEVVDGPWLAYLAPDGIRSFDLPEGVQPLPYVGQDGIPLAESVDPTLSWFLDYVVVSQEPFDVIVTLTEPASGQLFEAPLLAVQSEGNWPRALRPLPGGRVAVSFAARDDSTDIGVRFVALALDPATGLWTEHPTS